MRERWGAAGSKQGEEGSRRPGYTWGNNAPPERRTKSVGEKKSVRLGEGSLYSEKQVSKVISRGDFPWVLLVFRHITCEAISQSLKSFLSSLIVCQNAYQLESWWLCLCLCEHGMNDKPVPFCDCINCYLCNNTLVEQTYLVMCPLSAPRWFAQYSVVCTQLNTGWNEGRINERDMKLIVW